MAPLSEEHTSRCPCTELVLFISHSGIKGADEDELKEMASAPHSKHVYNVPNFDMIQEVQKRIIDEVCSGVDEQLSSLVSGEECKFKGLPDLFSWFAMVSVFTKMAPVNGKPRQ